MAAPHRRIPRSVLVLVPNSGDDRETGMTAIALCRSVYKQGMVPLSPLLYCAPFMTPEELIRELQWEKLVADQGLIPSIAQWWYKRSTRIWIAFPSRTEEELRSAGGVCQDLDRYSFNALRDNEKCVDRRPVFLILWTSTNFKLERLTRDDVQALLRANLSLGLTGALEHKE